MTTFNDVLIVDDDPLLVRAIKTVLEHQGYRCRCAPNGMRALLEVAAAKPALVLLDMLMPVMHGDDCARALRAMYGREFAIVFVTGDVTDRSGDLAADDVLSKPFGLDDLLRVVSAYAEHGETCAR
jgi:CheY-like chemotaxis protein